MIGKQYIVEITDKGVVTLGEFNRDRFVDMDCDDLDVLTDAEKKHVINNVLSKIRAEIERKAHSGQWSDATMYGMLKAVAVIDKYRAESGDKE